jgi:S-adenosylmethionine uptake transporter
MAAILVGLVGVILIVRPGPGGFDQHALYALVAVVCVTLRDIATRRLSSSVPSLSVAWAGALGVTLFGGLGAATIDWAPMGSREWSLLSGSALFILVAYLLSVMVMRRGEISFITPFRYTGLLWALLLGLVVFDEWPDALTLLGAAIVVATGIFTLWREARLSRRARAAA